MKVFSFLKKDKTIDPVDLSVLKTDMHSHLIPGIDDGAKEMSESIDLIKQLSSLGYKRLITTPHIMHDYYKNSANIIGTGLEALKLAVKAENLSIQLEAAAEYMLDDGFGEKIENGNLLSFGKKMILVEMSAFSMCPAVYEHVFNLQIAGFTVILAHPERYSYWFSEFDKFKDLKDRGVYFQLNAISLSGYYGNPVKKMAEKLIDEGMIEYIGSDIHNQTYMDGLIKSRTTIYLKKLLDSGKILNSTI